MNWLSGKRIGTRLALLSGVCLLLMVLMSVFATRQLSAFNDVNNDVTDNWLLGVEHASMMNNSAGDFRAAELQHILSTDAGEMAHYETSMADALKVLNQHMQAYSKLPSSPEKQAVWNEFDKNWSAYLSSHEKLLALSRANRNDEARDFARGESQKQYSAASEALDKLVEINLQGSDAAAKTADATYANARVVIWSVLIFAMVLAAVLSKLIASSMIGAMQQAVLLAQNISKGEIGNRVDTRGQSSHTEFGQLLQALESMDSKLCEIVGSVGVTADSVGTAARQISQGNDDLSQRTQEQASALEETAATMEEMTSTVKRNSDNAHQADQLGRQARTHADGSSEVVSRTIAAMEDINTASRKISDIINVIDEIAFQTNLLALNAAVEAARAGEQGRGFAVVASEVRNLAQRSASAAKEIKTLIVDSVDKVNTGTALVNESGKALNDIVNDVKRVTDIVAEIAAASSEQADGIEQINTAVTQMDNTTQQNAALVEEAASASKSMEQQASELIDQVGFFKIKGAAAHHGAAKAKPVASHTKLVSINSTKRKQPSRPQPVAHAPMARASGDNNTWTEF